MTATGEMGGRTGRGKGGLQPAVDLPIQSMGGRVDQTGGRLGGGATKDGGRWPRSTGQGEEDEHGGVRRGG
jgi:hypothetical protein